MRLDGSADVEVDGLGLGVFFLYTALDGGTPATFLIRNVPLGPRGLSCIGVAIREVVTVGVVLVRERVTGGVKTTGVGSVRERLFGLPFNGEAPRLSFAFFNSASASYSSAPSESTGCSYSSVPSVSTGCSSTESISVAMGRLSGTAGSSSSSYDLR